MKRIRILREAGGVGDVVRLFSVARAIREHFPAAGVWWFGLEYYRHLVYLCPAIDKQVTIESSERRGRGQRPDARRHPYLGRAGDFDLTFDMYCPALVHELETGGACTMDRVELWLRALGEQYDGGPHSLWPRDVRPLIRVTPELREQALHWLAQRRLDPSRLVVLQPFSTDLKRTWPMDRWVSLARELHRRGWQTLGIDCCSGRSRDLPGARFTDNAPYRAAAIVEWARLCIAPDSGIFHVAASLGVPTLGLFGMTSGSLMVRPYGGAAHYIQGPPQRGCASPCYARRERGCRRECRDRGCSVLCGINVESVLTRAASLLAPATSAARPRPASAAVTA